MPKRSNQFQRLIRHITESIAPTGATVRESVELLEQGVDAPIKREVDVLLELDVGLTSVRIALECRDHRRKSDVQWVDQLIGKYSHLPVDQVVAVSDSGLSESAATKAALNKIVVMSLEEASEAQWKESFATFGMLTTEQSYILSRFTLDLTPLPARIRLDDEVVLTNPGGDDRRELHRRTMTLQEFVTQLRNASQKHAVEHVKANALSIFKTVSDLDRVLQVDHRIPLAAATLRSRKDGQERTIRSAEIRYHVLTRRSEVDVTRHVVGGKAMVTRGVVPHGIHSDLEIEFATVQRMGDDDATVFIETRKRRGQGKKRG